MKRDWYQTNDAGNAGCQSASFCARCGIPVRVVNKNAKYIFNGREIKKRPLCGLCSKRDRELLLAVHDCMRLYGSMVTLYEIMDLYGDYERAKKLHFDPFSSVRVFYTGKDELSIRDVEAWVDEGIFEMSEEKKLTVRASEAREEIQRHFEIQQELEEKDENLVSPQENGSGDKTAKLSRLRDEGGASVGMHRWVVKRYQ